MRGIATIDRQPGGDSVVVWVTSVQGTEAQHHNAFEIGFDDEAEMQDSVASLTRCSAVLVTDGTRLEGLPIDGAPLTIADIEDLVAQTEAHQHAILAAITDYKRRTKSASLISPTFPISPHVADFFAPSDDTATDRAFAAANYLAKAWTGWLKTDEERRRRTARPKTGATPYIMPTSMNSGRLATFPEPFEARIHEQPLV